MLLAERLGGHPEVLITRYPRLASHPTHEAARREGETEGSHTCGT
jgi:cystathionine beta-lyase/cystathionine gamma-synthase